MTKVNAINGAGWEDYHWFNAPEEYAFSEGVLSLRTHANTDFWQRTHYGFRRDSGHALLSTVSGDFCIEIRTTFQPEAQYDQCGLFARIDSENWIKCSTEFEHENLSRLGSVVTNLGYSDWASQDLIGNPTSMAYRISRAGKDFLIEYALDDLRWHQMRVTRLHAAAETIEAGVYACSPVGEGFSCTFERPRFGPCRWSGGSEESPSA